MKRKKHKKVEPVKHRLSTHSSSNQHVGSSFLDSVASLSPSQLDAALMKMLKIDTDLKGMRAICEGKVPHDHLLGQ